MRAQIVPKFDWLESTVKHKVGWATRSWKLCTRGLLRAMSVYASLSFPLLSHAARLLDQLISKFIPLGNGTQNADKIVTEQHNHSEREIVCNNIADNKDSVTPNGQSSVSLANARRTPTN